MINPTLLKLLREASLSEPATLSGNEVLYEVNLAFPGLAEELLAVNNERNRPSNTSNAIRMRRSLSKGKWLFDGSPLRLNSDGIMDDGQHRSKEVTDALASGVLEEGSVLRSLVLAEMPPEAFLVYDIAAPRTAGNAMSMGGIKNAAIAASVTRLLTAYTEDDWPVSLNRKGQATNIEAVDAYHALNSGGLMERAVTKGHEVYDFNKAATTPRVMGAAYYLFAMLNQEKADEFFGQLTHKAPQDIQVSLLLATLAARYTAAESSVSRKSKGSDEEIVTALAMVIKTWNDWISGKQGRRLLKFAPKVEGYPVPLSGARSLGEAALAWKGKEASA